MPPAIKVRCPLCGHVVSIQTFERGPYPLEMFAMSGLGRGRGFSFKRIEVSPYVRELVVKKLREASQYLERVIKWVTVSLLRKTLCREVWIPLTLSCVVREYKIPIGGDVRVERG